MSFYLLPYIFNYFFFTGLCHSASNYSFVLKKKQNKLSSVLHLFLPFLKRTVTTPHSSPSSFPGRLHSDFPLQAVNPTFCLPRPRVPFHISSCVTSVWLFDPAGCHLFKAPSSLDLIICPPSAPPTASLSLSLSLALLPSQAAPLLCPQSITSYHCSGLLHLT